MRYRLIIFDFDGTLADSRDWMRGVFNGVARRYRFRTIDEAEMEMLRRHDNRAILRYLGVPGWKLPFIANHMRRLMSEDIDRIALFPGVDGILRRLSDAGVTLAIVSSNSEENVRRILGPANATLIAHYACGASLFGKAAKVRQALKRSRIAPAETLCIGDEARDVGAAVASKTASGAVTWGYATAELLKAQKPTLMFDALDEIGALAI
jgi:phosphoglycolate phosphatase